MEKTQGMGLDDLRQIHDAAQLDGCLGNLDRKDLVAGLCRSHEMTHRADAAGASRKGWHFTEWPTFAELFKSAELGDMKTRILHVSPVIQLDGDLGVALNASDRIDDDLLGHGVIFRNA